jgi:hypothetical protein
MPGACSEDLYSLWVEYTKARSGLAQGDDSVKWGLTSPEYRDSDDEKDRDVTDKMIAGLKLNAKDEWIGG